jgi:fermentation-respiration switch protein FrsA (DUF1100 family)
MFTHLPLAGRRSARRWCSFMGADGQISTRAPCAAWLNSWRAPDSSRFQWTIVSSTLGRIAGRHNWMTCSAPFAGCAPTRSSMALVQKRVGAFGHSAGAQLAALLGMEETRDNSDPALAKYSSKVQAVVDVSGPTDFTTEKDPEGIAFLTDFLGTDYGKQPQVWQEASPAFHISKEDAPFLIVHGTQDESVPISQAQELFERLQAAGVPVSFVKVDAGHTFQTPEARRQLAIETLAFFHRYLGATQN